MTSREATDLVALADRLVNAPESCQVPDRFILPALTARERDLIVQALRRAAARPDAGYAVKALEWIEREGVTGTFDASTSIGHYIATITEDNRGMWFIVSQTTANYMIANIGAVQRAAQADNSASDPPSSNSPQRPAMRRDLPQQINLMVCESHSK